VDELDEEHPGLAATMTIPARTKVAVRKREARMKPSRRARDGGRATPTIA
jgi:hypothetical protein